MVLRSVAALALAGLGMFCTDASPASAGGTDDVAFQIDVAHSGSTQFRNFAAPLTLKWNVDLGGIVSYPVIAKGKVYVTASKLDSSRLVALDLATGKIVWQVPIQNSLAQLSNITYEDGTVFDLNTDGDLQAFNGKTGKRKWSTQLTPQWSFYSPPIATGGIVYVNGSGEGATIYAINERTGRPVWTQDLEGTDFGAPAFGDDGLYLSYQCDAYKLDPGTGEIRWHYYYGCGGGSGLTPVYTRKLLYARNNFRSDLIFGAKDGSVKGVFAADWPPAFFTDTQGKSREAVIYGGVLYCLDAKTSTVLWAFVGDKNLSTSPLVINGQIVEGSYEGNLYVLDGDSGNLSWSTNVGQAIFPPYELSAQEALVGMGASDETLIVPATNNLLAFVSQ